MKKQIIKFLLAGVVVSTLGACKDFQEINRNPGSVDESSVQPEMLLNRSMFRAMQDSHIADRIFMRYWAGNSGYVGSMTSGDPNLGVLSSNNDWNTDYWGATFGSEWIMNATIAAQIAEQRIASGGLTTKPALNNIRQMCRIWRTVVLAQMADTFGPINQVGKFDGESANFESVENVYKHILAELEDAVKSIDFNVKLATSEAVCDIIYEGDMAKWARFGNSLRMRYGMRLSSLNPQLAQATVEAAAADARGFINDNTMTAKSRQDNNTSEGPLSDYNRWEGSQVMSRMMSNVIFGLGGINPKALIGNEASSLKSMTTETFDKYAADPMTYLGLKMEAYLPSETNVDGMSFFFDRIPSNIDPRAFFNYAFPGVTDEAIQFKPLAKDAETGEFDPVVQKFYAVDGTLDPEMNIAMRAAYTWYTHSSGSYGDKGTRFQGWNVSVDQSYYPNIIKNIRGDARKFEWFPATESYFIMAEAALYGWNVGMTAKAAYEEGVTLSFEQYGIGELATAYLASQSFNRVGTSVSFDHTAEAQPVTMSYIDFADKGNFEKIDAAANLYALKASPTVKNDYSYKFTDGKAFNATQNDQLTKVITQKYIANMPYNPLETWCDYRRLVRPFRENPVLGKGGKINTMPTYTQADAMSKTSLSRMPYRVPYPFVLNTNSEALYKQALVLLGGPDAINTPMPWAKK